MADWYIDPAGGNDITGDGLTHLTAYATVTNGLFMNETIAAGDTIKVANAGEAVEAPWVWTNVSTAVDNPVRWEAYEHPSVPEHYKTRADGSQIPIAKFDGNGQSSITGTGGKSYVTFRGINFRNTTSYCVYFQNGWTFDDCDFSDCIGTYLATGGGNGQAFFNCTFRDAGIGYSGSCLKITGGSCVSDCSFDTATNHGIYTGNTYATVQRCVFKNIDNSGIVTTNRDYISIEHCTFVSDGENDAVGVEIETTNSEWVHVRNCLFAGYNGTGADGIDVRASCMVGVLGPNAFYDCTTNMNIAGAVGIDNTANDVLLVSDPFVNAAGGDYNIDTGSPAFASATCPSHFAGAKNLSFGAIQHVQAAGGGGGTTVRAC